jgi:hypothetical protein
VKCGALPIRCFLDKKNFKLILKINLNRFLDFPRFLIGIKSKLEKIYCDIIYFRKSVKFLSQTLDPFFENRKLDLGPILIN